MNKELIDRIDKLLLDFDLQKWDKGKILEPSSFLIGYLSGKGIEEKEVRDFVFHTLVVGSPGWDKWSDYYLEENQDETESSNSN